MRVTGVMLFLIIGAAAAATAARAEGDADKNGEIEKTIEAFSDDGHKLHAGPLHERSRLEEVRARLAEAHQRAPEDDAITIKLAVVESRTGHHDRAVTLLAEISAVSSFRALALYDLGLVHAKVGRLAEARDVLIEAAAVGSDRAEPAIALGGVHDRLGDTKAAAQAFELAEKRARGQVAVTCAMRAGALHERAGALDEALAAYLRAGVAMAAAATAEPGVVPALQRANDRGSHVEAGRVLLRLGRAAEAAAELEKALEASEDAELRFKLGLARFLAGKPAEEDIARLEKSDPELAKKLAELVARKRDVK